MKKKNALSPNNASEAEIRHFLLASGVQAFRVLAGMIPQNTANEDVPLPEFVVLDNKLSAVARMKQIKDEIGRTFFLPEKFGVKHTLVLGCKEPICYDCSYYVRAYFKFNFELGYDWLFEKCCLCGGVCDDPIPF